MNTVEVTGLLGRVRERAAASAFYEPAWRSALSPLDAGRAGTALVRYLAGLHRTDDPSIAGFLDVYGPVPADHPLSDELTGDTARPTPSTPCDRCDSTGWIEVDIDRPSAGVKPCDCDWGALAAPTHRALAHPGVPALNLVRETDPPWRRLGITPAEWTQRQTRVAS